MSLLLRAALLGGIAYLITRSLSQPGNSPHRRALSRGGAGAAPLGQLHPGENNLWPTSESQERAGAAAGPSS